MTSPLFANLLQITWREVVRVYADDVATPAAKPGVNITILRR